MFDVRLFGGLSLESSTTSLPPSALQRRRLTLLALLALPGRRGMSRERVQAYLWPESTSGHARHALDQLLYATRRDLGSDSLLSNTTDLRLNPNFFRADVWTFDEVIDAGCWEDAANLYAGPILEGLHLIDGSDFERWLDAERLRREQQHHHALEVLAKESADRGDFPGAVQWWRRRAAADPLSASVALDLMRALGAAGDGAGAARHGRIYGEVVRASLQMEPDPAVEALASSLVTPERSSGVPSGLSTETARVAAPAAADVSASPITMTKAEGTLASAREQSTLRPRRRLRAVRAAIIVFCAAIATLLVSSQGRNTSRAASVAMRANSPNDVPVNTPIIDGAAHRTADAAARALYLRGRAAWEKRTKAGLEDAVVLYRQATQRDPVYAAAYTGLAESYAMLGYFGFGAGDVMFPKAGAAAQKALELDPSAGEAYAVLGQSLAWQHKWVRSEQAYRRAIALVPNNPTAHQWYALLLAYVGRPHEAALQTGIASRLDPLSVQINNMHGMMLYYAGMLDSSVRQFERTVEEEPDTAWVRQNPWVLTNFGRVAAAAGREKQAIHLIEAALVVVPAHPRLLLDLGAVYVLGGKPQHAWAAFARADSAHPHYPAYRGLMHATTGELDQAFAWFDRVSEWPLPALVGLSCDTRFAPLRADARFGAIRKRLKLPPVPARSS
ncbi:MAG: tetratricopeptide repeat protein [Gemmatimonadaceae bacterium]